MQTKIEPLSSADSISAGGMAKFGIGQPVRRTEDLRFVRGAGRYVDDDAEPGILHAAFLRSSHAHADVRSIGISAARGAQGVVAVYTGEDWHKAGLPGLPLR